MMKKRGTPCGIGNWAELVRNNGCLYVDHTAYIRVCALRRLSLLERVGR